MSYEKAIKHHRNIRKCKKQGRQWMGFDCSEDTTVLNKTQKEIKEDVEFIKYCIYSEYVWRHRGKYGDLHQVRQTIRDQISRVRNMQKKLPARDIKNWRTR